MTVLTPHDRLTMSRRTWDELVRRVRRSLREPVEPQFRTLFRRLTAAFEVVPLESHDLSLVLGSGRPIRHRAALWRRRPTVPLGRDGTALFLPATFVVVTAV